MDEKESYCSICQNLINENKIEFNNRLYHSNCFKCSICQRYLNDLKTNRFQLDDRGEPICSNCELSKAKICFICDKPIIDENILMIDQKNYHANCFNCSKCQKSLINQKDIRRNNSKIVCFQCYHRDFAPKCEQCSEPISTGKTIIFNENKYHLDCFRCNQCKQIINDQNVSVMNSKCYCDQCYQKYFAPQCDKCLKTILNEKFTSFKGKSYHSDCFRCHYCNETIMENKFATKNENIYCIQCFEQNIAPKCVQCLQIISTGTVTNYDNNQYHPECFRCIKCDKIMAENKFHTHNHKPCCNQCYNEHFVLRCSKCSEPILDRYTQVQKKSFHIQCFNCSKCHRVIESGEKHFNGEFGVLCSSCVN